MLGLFIAFSANGQTSAQEEKTRSLSIWARLTVNQVHAHLALMGREKNGAYLEGGYQFRYTQTFETASVITLGPLLASYGPVAEIGYIRRPWKRWDLRIGFQYRNTYVDKGLRYLDGYGGEPSITREVFRLRDDRITLKFLTTFAAFDFLRIYGGAGLRGVLREKHVIWRGSQLDNQVVDKKTYSAWPSVTVHFGFLFNLATIGKLNGR